MAENKSKEQEDLERFRAKYPDLDIQITPKEERSQHRIYVGSHPPVAKMPKRDEDTRQ